MTMAQQVLVAGVGMIRTSKMGKLAYKNGIMSASHRSGVTITYPPHDIDAVSA
jgi:hypothetical protein